MKHVAEISFWLGVFGWLGVSSYFSHVEQVECMKRGHQWVINSGCRADYCQVKK